MPNLNGLGTREIMLTSLYTIIHQEVDTTVLGLSKEEALKKPYIASMGVYVFKKEILLNLLRYLVLENL
jgi:ADP-glucose pyrophosphorylase